MTEPRIVRLAAAARAAGLVGYKIDERHPMLGGAQLRLWGADRPEVWQFRRTAVALGFDVPLMAPHVWSADSTEYDGWQLCIIVPADDLVGLRHAIGTDRPAIDAASREIGP